MERGKDSAEVVRFMAAFQKLRARVGDEPQRLPELAAADQNVKALCHELSGAAMSLSMNERRRRNLFAAPVDPAFIAAWRDYEREYDRAISYIVWDLSNLLPELVSEEPPRVALIQADAVWANADEDAAESAGGIEEALAFAEEQMSDDWNEYPEPLKEKVLDATDAWRRLKAETGLDLRGVFRRRELIPFVLVPRHVAQRHGNEEKLSLFTHLQQAHDAFVFGVPFAAVALMRSITETVLRDHYGALGGDLKQRIDNCRSLPAGASKMRLHRLRHLANDVLHLNKRMVRLPKDLEKELVALLQVLRVLIEEAPSGEGR